MVTYGRLYSTGLHHTIPAVEDATEYVLLDHDLGILEYLLDLDKQTRMHTVSEKKALLTRVLSKKYEIEEALDIQLSKDSEANLVDLGNIFEFEDELSSSDNMSDKPIHWLGKGKPMRYPIMRTPLTRKS